MNPMQNVRIEKLTLNVGAGKDQKMLEKGAKLLKNLTGIEPVKTVTNKRVQAWHLRPGLPIGVKLTLRGKQAEELLSKLLSAKEKVLKETCFDDHGNVSFGIPEYVDIEDAKYDPDIGIIGLQASVTLDRAGYRVKKRKLQKGKIPTSHKVGKQDAIAFMKEKYSVTTGEEA